MPVFAWNAVDNDSAIRICHCRDLRLSLNLPQPVAICAFTSADCQSPPPCIQIQALFYTIINVLLNPRLIPNFQKIPFVRRKKLFDLRNEFPLHHASIVEPNCQTAEKCFSPAAKWQHTLLSRCSRCPRWSKQYVPAAPSAPCSQPTRPMLKSPPCTTPIPVTRDTVKRLAVVKQGLHQRPPSSAQTDLKRIIERIGLLQLDSISVVARSHYLVMLRAPVSMTLPISTPCSMRASYSKAGRMPSARSP